jgi:hypothetical protein
MAWAMPEAALPVWVVAHFQFQPHFALSATRLWKARNAALLQNRLYSWKSRVASYIKPKRPYAGAGRFCPAVLPCTGAGQIFVI